MAEWLIEQGIGEDRAILFDGGTAIAARMDWPGSLCGGQVEDALLVSRQAGSSRGTARFANGEEALVDGLPGDASEGASLRLVVTRAALAETGRYKLARARPTGEEPRPALSLADRLGGSECDVRVVRRFPGNVWQELFTEAWDGELAFDGGSLSVTPTPAMTLIDVDGALPPRQLALAAIPAIARAIGLLDLAGSIGIDFPTLESKADRAEVDQALERVLAGWPHERTAMNGFGFVQLVARLEGPSLLHRINLHRAAAAARLLLRQAEGVTDPGSLLLTAHPAVHAAVTSEWAEELRRRTGRTIAWKDNPALALQSGFAQAVAT